MIPILLEFLDQEYVYGGQPPNTFAVKSISSLIHVDGLMVLVIDAFKTGLTGKTVSTLKLSTQF